MANMIFRNLDSSGDWVFGMGTQAYARNEDAINLNIATSIKSWVGDCFFALQFGINWKQLLSVGQQKNLDLAIQSLILGSYGVTGIVQASVNFNPSTRLLSTSYTINTVYSTQVTNTVAILAGVGT